MALMGSPRSHWTRVNIASVAHSLGAALPYPSGFLSSKLHGLWITHWRQSRRSTQVIAQYHNAKGDEETKHREEGKEAGDNDALSIYNDFHHA